MKLKALLTALLLLAALFTLSACASKAVSIQVASLPDKLEYEIGETLDLTNGKITAYLENGKTKTMSMTSPGVIVTGFDASKAASVELTVYYKDLTCKFSVVVVGDVVEPALTNVELGSLPTVTTYFLGGSLDLTGGTLKLSYDSGPQRTIPMTEAGVTIMPYSFSEEGYVTVTLSYKGHEVSFPVLVKQSGVDRLEIISLPDLLIYNLNGVLDLRGGVIRAHYDNGWFADFSMNAPKVKAIYDFSECGERMVRIEFEDASIEFPVTVLEEEDYVPDFDYLYFWTLEANHKIMPSYEFGEDIIFLYFYYEGQYHYEKIMASGNYEWLYEWEEWCELYFSNVQKYANMFFARILDDLFIKNFAQAAGRINYLLYYDEFYYPDGEDFNNDAYAMINTFKQLSEERLSDLIYYAFDAEELYIQYSVWYYTNILGEYISSTYLQMIQAQFKLLKYEFPGGNERDIKDFFRLMRDCIALYNGLTDPEQVLFAEYFPEYYSLQTYFDLHYEPQPDGYDWAYLEFVIEEGYLAVAGSQRDESDLLFLWFWFEAERCYNEIIASGDTAWKDYFDFYFETDYNVMKAWKNNAFYNNSAMLFDDAYLKDVIVAAAWVMYCTTYFGDAYNPKTPEFQYDVLDLISLYKQLTVIQKGNFIGWVKDGFTSYAQFSTWLYNETLGNAIASVYLKMVVAEMYYTFYLFTSNDTYYSYFVEDMTECVNAFNSLSDKETYLEYFPEYEGLEEILLGPAPDGYNWIYVAYIIAKGLEATEQSKKGGGELLYLWFLSECEYHYNQIISSENDEWITYWGEFFAESYATIYARRDYFIKYAPTFFTDPVICEMSRIASKMVYYWIYDSAYYPGREAFNSDAVALIEAYKQLSNAQCNIFFSWVLDAYYYVTQFTAWYYSNIFGAIIAEVYIDMIQAEINLKIFYANGYKGNYNSFMNEMAECIYGFDRLSDQSFYLAHFPEYTGLKAQYDEFVANPLFVCPEPIVAIISKNELYC